MCKCKFKMSLIALGGKFEEKDMSDKTLFKFIIGLSRSILIANPPIFPFLLQSVESFLDDNNIIHTPASQHEPTLVEGDNVLKGRSNSIKQNLYDYLVDGVKEADGA